MTYNGLLNALFAWEARAVLEVLGIRWRMTGEDGMIVHQNSSSVHCTCQPLSADAQLLDFPCGVRVHCTFDDFLRRRFCYDRVQTLPRDLAA